MPFPISRTGSVAVPADPHLPVTADQLLDRVEHALTERGAVGFVRDGRRLHFRSALLLPGSNWNVLASVSSGWVEAEVGESRVVLRYDLRLMRLFGLMGAISVPFLVFVAPMLYRQVDGRTVVLVSVVMQLLSFGINYAISIARFPGFFLRAIGPAAQHQVPSSMTLSPWAPGQPPRFPRR